MMVAGLSVYSFMGMTNCKILAWQSHNALWLYQIQITSSKNAGGMTLICFNEDFIGEFEFIAWILLGDFSRLPWFGILCAMG